MAILSLPFPLWKRVETRVSDPLLKNQIYLYTLGFQEEETVQIKLSSRDERIVNLILVTLRTSDKIILNEVSRPDFFFLPLKRGEERGFIARNESFRTDVFLHDLFKVKDVHHLVRTGEGSRAVYYNLEEIVEDNWEVDWEYVQRVKKEFP